MRALFSRSEIRFLATGLVGSLLVAGLGLGWWLSPLSPAALDGPARQAARGDEAGAVAAYQDLARSWAPESVQQRALWQAGLLAAVDLPDPHVAVGIFDEFLVRWPDSPLAAEVDAQLAVLYSQRLGDPVAAGLCWMAAADLAPLHPDAGAWLVKAGRALSRGGRDDLADAALASATTYPDVAASAWVALGRQALQKDPARAYDDFDKALTVAGAGPEARIARLGLVTALERLERRESALAALDEAIAEGDADDALVRRQQRLQSER